MLLVVCSWLRGERQVVFLFIVFLFAVAALLFPLARIGGAVHNHRERVNPEKGSTRRFAAGLFLSAVVLVVDLGR